MTLNRIHLGVGEPEAPQHFPLLVDEVVQRVSDLAERSTVKTGTLASQDVHGELIGNEHK